MEQLFGCKLDSGAKASHASYRSTTRIRDRPDGFVPAPEVRCVTDPVAGTLSTRAGPPPTRMLASGAADRRLTSHFLSATMWRTHSCVPCRHSCRHAGVVDARRDESRRGTQECVRHGSCPAKLPARQSLVSTPSGVTANSCFLPALSV